MITTIVTVYLAAGFVAGVVSVVAADACGRDRPSVAVGVAELGLWTAFGGLLLAVCAPLWLLRGGLWLAGWLAGWAVGRVAEGYRAARKK